MPQAIMTPERTSANTRPRRWGKEITLLSICILVLAVFFLLPRNGRWVADRLLPYCQDLTARHDRTPDQRRAARYGEAFTFSRRLAARFPRKDSVLLLVPPRAYFKQCGIDYPVPEPAVFYYYTGLKTTWANSPMSAKANWIVCCAGKSVTVQPVRSAQQLADSIASYKKWGYEL